MPSAPSDPYDSYTHILQGCHTGTVDYAQASEVILKNLGKIYQ